MKKDTGYVMEGGGICMELLTPQAHMHMHGTCTAHARHMHGTCSMQGHARHMHGTRTARRHYTNLIACNVCAMYV
jgi:hypothetical protein